ncbi:MAG: UBP-type zinc finger domain-containing protein [Thermoproteota archaeon]|nr:UBP-type zinc finger domain-containing protein [Thermoproteota archaeon]
MDNSLCEHFGLVNQTIKPRTPSGCEECLQIGSEWIYLRLCLSCGHVGCCDSSPTKHATKHFHKMEHPIVKSLEPCENWEWCYINEILVE